MQKHLKSHQYYIDLYDRHTVEDCRRIERISEEVDVTSPESKEMSEEEKKSLINRVGQLHLHFTKGERYLNRDKTIREWMDRDQQLDDFYESAQAPEDIRCLTCRNRLKPTLKELWFEHDKKDRVLFMYDCVNQCLPRRAFFSDGEEWRAKPNLCPHCNVAFKQETKENIKKIITTYTCSECSCFKVDELELGRNKEEEEVDVNFAKDRDRFCMTKEEGDKYQEERWNLERVGEIMKEFQKEQEARQEKLKENPKGFHLEGAGYTCAVCSNSTSDGNNWYDEYGIKCLVCQKAIDEGEIPASVAKDKESWYSKYDLERSFGLKGPSLRKWIKEGRIKPRIISQYGTGVHTQIFLIEDNKDFLPPKKLVDSHIVKEMKDGKEWHQMHPWYHFGDPKERLKGYKILEYLKFVPIEKKEGE